MVLSAFLCKGTPPKTELVFLQDDPITSMPENIRKYDFSVFPQNCVISNWERDKAK